VQGNGYPVFFNNKKEKLMWKDKKSITIGVLIVIILGLAWLNWSHKVEIVKPAAASTLDMWFADIDKEIGYERATQGDTQTLYGSLGIGPVSFGASFEDDLSVDGIQFDNAGYDLDLAQDIGWVTVYANNALDEDFALTETTIGVKWSF
jgi:hypothetical protein